MFKLKSKHKKMKHLWFLIYQWMSKRFEKSFIQISKTMKKKKSTGGSRQTNKQMNKQQQQSLKKRKKSIRKLYDKHTLNGLFIFWIENHFDSDNFDASICFFFKLVSIYRPISKAHGAH